MSDDEKEPASESIKVCCRFRPQNAREKEESGKICVEMPAVGSTVKVLHNSQIFQLDRAFRWDASQKSVYEYAAKPIVDAVLKGFNGTVFAYGQTGSGKTYTMEGPDIEDKVNQGVIPRMVANLFDGIYHADEHIEFLVKVSMVEIYNEKIRDLLDATKDNLQIREDNVRGIYVQDVTEEYVGSDQEVFQTFRAGHINRSCASTNMNEQSSRSHLVFMLTLEQKNCHDHSIKVGKLYLVDLAGSEKVGKTGAAGDRLDEAKSINKSLSALGNVINALTERSQNSKIHVPYRDSKLTRMLTTSLGGNAKTSLIVTCSPSTFNEPETVSTLRFGQRAKMVKNVAKINQERTADELQLLIHKRELTINDLRGRIVALEQGLTQHGIPVPENTIKVKRFKGAIDDLAADMQDIAEDKAEELSEKQERITELTETRDELKQRIKESEDEARRIQEELDKSTSAREAASADMIVAAQTSKSLEREVAVLQETYAQLQKQNVELFSKAAPRSASPRRKANGVARSGSRDVSRRQSGEDKAANGRKDADGKLKLRVAQLDKSLEQLTMMYHKLVGQNNGLKDERDDKGKHVHRKEKNIEKLEKHITEAKHKYEKLLTQCSNLTAAMDVIGRSNPAAAGATGTESMTLGGPRKTMNVVVPLKGGRRTMVGDNMSAAVSAALGKAF